MKNTQTFTKGTSPSFMRIMSPSHWYQSVLLWISTSICILCLVSSIYWVPDFRAVSPGLDSQLYQLSGFQDSRLRLQGAIFAVRPSSITEPYHRLCSNRNLNTLSTTRTVYTWGACVCIESFKDSLAKTRDSLKTCSLETPFVSIVLWHNNTILQKLK